MQELIAILEGLHPDVDFETEDRLIDGKILDSFDIISIVSEVNDQFGVDIIAADLLPENFNSAAALYELIKSMQ